MADKKRGASVQTVSFPNSTLAVVGTLFLPANVEAEKKYAAITVVHLPEISVRGNPHFPFSDLSNLEIADLLPHGCTSRGWTSPYGATPRQGESS